MKQSSNLFKLYIPEFLIAITHFAWIGCWWFTGHIIYLIFVGCDESGLTACSGRDVFSLILVFISSMIYIRIANYVVRFLYKGELPVTNDLVKNFMNQSNGRNNGRNQKGKRKTKKY